jgi:prolyl oligopeptidase
VPFTEGTATYFFYNSGLQPQSVMMLQNQSDDGAKPFLDVNKMSTDGTLSLNSSSFSEDGKTLAYALSQSGSDWVKVYHSVSIPDSHSLH